MATITTKIADLAQEIVDETTTTDTAAFCASWIRHNVGALNNEIGTSYVIDDSDHEISPLLGDNEKFIFKLLFELYQVNKLIKQNSGSSAFTAVQEVRSDGGVVRLANRTGVLNTLLELRKQLLEQLGIQAGKYKSQLVEPQQVAGDDSIDASMTNYLLSSDLPLRSREY